MDINECITCTLDPWYWNENNVQHDESWED
jgi:hypothetical protein